MGGGGGGVVESKFSVQLRPKLNNSLQQKDLIYSLLAVVLVSELINPISLFYVTSLFICPCRL